MHTANIRIQDRFTYYGGMLHRILVAALVLVAALIVFAASAPARTPWPFLASAGLGERHYAVRLKHLPVGQLVQSTTKDAQGNFHFSSQLEFQLAQGQPVRVFETKVFSGLPPFELIHAEQIDTTAATTNRVVLSPGSDADPATTYLAQISRGSQAQKQTQTQSLTWQHGLSDYLAVEDWLPYASIDARATFSSIDFDSLSLRNDVWTLLDRNEDGFEVTKSSQLEATRLFLDPKFKPVRFSMAGTFEIELVDASTLPISPEPVFHSQTYQVPVSEPLKDHQLISGLTLRVTGNTELVHNWESAAREGSKTLLRSFAGTRRSQPNTEAAAAQFLREELSYPLSAEAVVELASQAVDPNASLLEQASQLTSFVHTYIAYDHHSTMQNVLDVIRNQNGDCNEYAELYTTLARALGLPARTVIGLAYTDEYAPAFALHAWNEVLVNDEWHSFDPTWNQTRVDATHLPLPNDAGGMLEGITSLDEIEFEIVSLNYDFNSELNSK